MNITVDREQIVQKIPLPRRQKIWVTPAYAFINYIVQQRFKIRKIVTAPQQNL